MSESRRNDSGSRIGFSVRLRIALIIAILLAYGAWLLQWMAAFPVPSLGSSATAGALTLGVALAIITAPIGIFQLARTPTSRTGASYVLTGICSVPLLLALAAGITLLVGG